METVVRVRKLGPSLIPDKSVPEVTISGKGSGGHGIELATEMSGLVDPVSEAYTRAPGGRPGTRLVSTRFTERNVVFRVTILGDSDEWFANEQVWRSLWSYDSYTEIEVVTAKKKRVLRVRLEEYEVDTNYDPAVMGAVDVNMSVVADDPFWYDAAFIRSWRRVDGLTRYDFDSLHGPVFPRFKVGNASGVTINYATDRYGRYIALPNSLNSAYTYHINLDPGSRQVSCDKDPNVWNRMNGVRFDLPDSDKINYFSVAPIDRGVLWVQVECPYMRPW